MRTKLTLAIVTNIIDGDTIDILIKDIAQRVRLIGVDSPERDEVGFDEATAFTRDQIKNVGNVVWLEKSGKNRDRFERLRRYVWLEKPTIRTDFKERAEKLLNVKLIDSGHAVSWDVSPKKRTSEGSC